MGYKHTIFFQPLYLEFSPANVSKLVAMNRKSCESEEKKARRKIVLKKRDSSEKEEEK